MKTNTTFDNKIDLIDKQNFHCSSLDRQRWNEVKDAAIFVNDTLDLCSRSAKQVFGDAATPADAFAIYDRIIPRLKQEAEQTFAGDENI